MNISHKIASNYESASIQVHAWQQQGMDVVFY